MALLDVEELPSWSWAVMWRWQSEGASWREILTRRLLTTRSFLPPANPLPLPSFCPSPANLLLPSPSRTMERAPQCLNSSNIFLCVQLWHIYQTYLATVKDLNQKSRRYISMKHYEVSCRWSMSYIVPRFCHTTILYYTTIRAGYNQLQ